jgi:hypothetical protein
MWATRVGALALVTAILAGCGTYVPGIPDFPSDQSSPGATQLLVKAILESIHCEIKNSVQYVVGKDIEYAEKYRSGYREAKWFDDWGAQGALTLMITEKSETNPTATWIPNPITALFTLAGGADVSSAATRTDVLNFYYNVSDLAYKETPCTYPYSGNHPLGSLLINSDLGLREWLESVVLAVATGSTQLLQQKDGITQTVKFQVVSRADITPIWKLTRFSVNSKGTFLSATRDRLHELLLTFGPVNKETKTLVGPAAGQFFAGQIGGAISNRLNNLLP